MVPEIERLENVTVRIDDVVNASHGSAPFKLENAGLRTGRLA
jgi:hypothetical protein